MGIDQTQQLFAELSVFPNVINDNSWRLDVGNALAQVLAGVNLLESLPTVEGASEIHGQMLLIAYQSRFFVENVAYGIDDDDVARIEAAAGDLDLIDGYIADLSRQVETFCD